MAERVIQLTTNLSDALIELLHENEAPIDAVEVGPWFSVPQIRDYRRTWSELPFYFHGSDLIERVGLIPGTMRKMRAYLRCTNSPWLSVHITMWLPGMVWLMLRHGCRPPLPNSARATRRLIRQVRQLVRAMPVPIVLENMEALPFEGYHFEVEPERIGKVLDKTHCGFVLDIWHARSAAMALGRQVYDYLVDLPLERTLQVHTSGPRHEPMQETDYILLDWVLTQTQPQVVTLEYIRERDKLHEQLFRLRELIDFHNRKRAI